VVNIKDYKKPPIIVTDLSVYHRFIEPLEKIEYPLLPLKLHEHPDDKKLLKKFLVSGISCSGSDILKHECLLPEDIKIGDILYSPLAGAYTSVMENFQMKEFPKIFAK